MVASLSLPWRSRFDAAMLGSVSIQGSGDKSPLLEARGSRYGDTSTMPLIATPNRVCR